MCTSVYCYCIKVSLLYRQHRKLLTTRLMWIKKGTIIDLFKDSIESIEVTLQMIQKISALH